MPISEADMKILWGGAAGRCSNPRCRRELIEVLPSGKRVHVGEHAHVIADSPAGPRGRAGSTRAVTDPYENHILLCGTCHTLIDKSPGDFPPELLHAWKRNHESWVDTGLQTAVVEVTFAELEVVCASISDAAPLSTDLDLRLTPPTEKMRKNGISERLHGTISMGLSQAGVVRRFLTRYNEIDPQFAERLVNGFKTAYVEAELQGLGGDRLYRHLASHPGSELSLHAARIALVAYLFHSCDIFEP